MKNYFSHDIDARNDLKMIRLRKRHGLAGIGAFWCICERLCAADGYRIDADFEGIALELDCDESFIRSVVTDFGLFVVEDGKMYSRSMCERMAIKDEKAKVLSEAGRRGAQKRWGCNGEAMATLLAPNSPHIAPNGNKIKENKIKENNNTPTSCVYNTRTREDEFFDSLFSNDMWRESVCMQRHLTTGELDKWLGEFRGECAIKAAVHSDEADVKRHFFDWLRIQQEKAERKQDKRKGNGNPIEELSPRELYELANGL